MVIRHAEKPYAGDSGWDEDGEDDAGSLAGRGWRRAEELPRLFPPPRAPRCPAPQWSSPPAARAPPSGAGRP